MAAGAYKGLTIRIGADITRLSSALRGANSVIYKTQSQLTKLNRAAKLDPGNTGVMTRQFGAVSSQATNLAAKMDVLRQGLTELGKTPLEGTKGNVAELAKETQSAALEAERAKEVYDSLTKQINELYAPIKDNTGIDLHKSTADGTFEEDITFLRRMGEITIEQEMEIRNLRERWNEANDALTNYSNAAKLEEMKNDIAATDAQLMAMSRTYAQLQMKSNLSRSFAGLDSQLRLVNSAAEMAKNRFERLNNAAKINPGNIGLAVDRVKALSEALENSKSKADILKQKIAAYKADGVEKTAKEIGNISKAFQESQENIAKAKKELEDYRTRADATEDGVRQLEDALRQAEEAGRNVAKVSEWQELEAQLHEVNSEARELKESLSLSDFHVGAAAVNAATAIGDLMRDAGRAVIDSSNDVDAAYRDLRKTFDAEESDYQRLYDAAMKYSQIHVTSADDMLEMEAIAGQLGVGLKGGAEAIQEFAEVAANLDVATDIDTETIALQMGQIMNVMSDLDYKNVQGFGDALVDLGNKMPAQESAIMQIAQRLSSVGDVAGFSTPEVLGWAAAVASTGQRSEAAATGISNTITAIQSAVSRGGDDLEAFAGVVGKTADEFKESWERDASGTLRDFIGELQGLGPDAIKQLEDLGIEGVRQTQTLLGLAKTVENVDSALEISTAAWDGFKDGTTGAGAAADEANKKAQGFSGTFSKLQNSTKVLAASFGDALVPLMTSATSLIQGLTDVLNGLGPGFKSAAVTIGAVFSAIGVGVPIITPVAEAFKKLFTAVKGAGAIKIGQLVRDFGSASVQVTGFGSALMSLGASGAIATGAIAGVAALVGGYYIAQYVKAKIHTDNFNNALSSIQGTTDGLHKDLLLGKDAVSGYGDAWSAARANVDDFLKSASQHADTMSQTRDQTATSIGMLEKYTSIIDKAIGAGDSYTGSMGELQWALDGLAQITGETYSAEEILSGSFEGEAGNADKLRDSIMKLVEAKKLESQLNAITSMRTEAVKGQMEALDVVNKSADAYRDYAEVVKKAHGDMSGEEFASYVANSKNSDAAYLRQLEDDWSEAKKVYDEWGGQIDKLDKEYDGLIDKQAYQESTAYGEREGIMQTTRAMKDALDAVGMTDDGIKELSASIERAGVSTKEFSEIGADSFAAMVDQSGGDIGVLTDMIASFNSLPIDDKEAAIHVEDGELVFANGERIVWNGTEWVWKSTGITVDAASVADATQQVNDMNAATDGMHDASANAEVTGNAKDPATSQNISNTGGAISGMTSNTVQGQVNGNAKDSGTAAAISNTAGAIASLMSRTVDVVVNYVQNGKAPGQSASGAYIPYNKIPKHAAGIFTRPTLTNIGWVGEDGAELYSGNSLVPLTNRKYSMPYIDDISDAVAKKLGGLGTVNNYYVNDAIVNGDAEIQAAFLTLFDTLTRKGAMNVG